MDLNDLLADPRVVWTEDVLRFGDTDANGHINNALFATLCESGRSPRAFPGKVFSMSKSGGSRTPGTGSQWLKDASSPGVLRGDF